MGGLDTPQEGESAGPRPALSVVVLSHNRSDLLRRTLASVAAQKGVEVEVIVVDNASTDGTPEMVESSFPEVVLVRNPVNLGIRGRNIGFDRASAPLILSLDGDIEIEDDTVLFRLVERMTAGPGIGALTLKIREEETGADYTPTHWWHPLPRLEFQDLEFDTDHINEAAVVFRTSVLREAGGYYEALFWGGEEWDLSLAIWDLGYQIRYFPIPVLHLAPRGNLNRRRDPRHALLIRNRCWIAFRRLPLGAALVHTLPRLVLWGARAVRYGYLDAYLRGLGQLLVSLPAIVRSRKPISPDTHAQLRLLRRGDCNPQPVLLGDSA